MFQRRRRARLDKQSKLRSGRRTNDVARSYGRLLRHEALEDRRVLALLGVAPVSQPIIGYDSGGSVSYNAATKIYSINATPLNIQSASGSGLFFTGSLKINIQLNSSGVLVSGVPGDDMLLSGDVDVNGDFVPDYTAANGPLLKGEIIAFGSQDSGGTSDNYDFRFRVTGGQLASLYANKDLGIVTTSENSTFTGSFTTNFGGGAKGSIGAIDKGCISGTKYTDRTGNGLSYDDTPLANVVINLFQDTNGNGRLDGTEGSTIYKTTTTNASGNYSFAQLPAGKYIVQEVVPADYQATSSTEVAVTLAAGCSVTCKSFSNFQKVGITGKKYADITGNGISSDDTSLGDVTIKLYKGTSANGPLVASTSTSTTDGSYSFTNLAIGTYFVQEVVPNGFVQTAGNAGYVVVVGPGGVMSGGVAAGKDFANYEKCDHSHITCITYTITRGNKCFTVKDLVGNVLQGDIVTVNFTVTGGGTGPEQVSLVSYTAPNGYYDPNRASLQKVYEAQTGFFLPGTHSLTVNIPCSYFQVDFVCDGVIDRLGTGSNIYYNAQGRYLGGENGGKTAASSNMKPLGTTLVVGGSAGDDDVQFKVAANPSKISVNINGSEVGQVSFSSGSGVPITKLAGYGYGGNDSILVTGLSLPALLYGGDGNDILVGGSGADTIQGDAGRDIIIGGAGKDVLRGGGQDDLLIGGTTSFDANLSALDQIMQEWSRNDTFTNRVNHLNGTTAGGLNGSNFLITSGGSKTVFDDGVQDTIYGDDGSDWVLGNNNVAAGLAKDVINSAELVSTIS